MVSRRAASGPKPTSTNEINPEKVRIGIHGLDTSLYFAIRRGTRLKRVLDLFSNNLNMPVSNLKFSFDGKPVRASDTPSSIGLEDNELIEASVKGDSGSY